MILCNLGRLYTEVQQWDQARSSLDRAAEISKRIGDPITEAKAFGNLGLMYFRMGELERSQYFCEQQLEIARKLADRHTAALALYNLGIVIDAMGKRHQAREMMKEAIQVSPSAESSIAQQAQAWLASGVGEESASVRHEVRQGRYDELREIVESTRVSSGALFNQKLNK